MQEHSAAISTTTPTTTTTTTTPSSSSLAVNYYPYGINTTASTGGIINNYQNITQSNQSVNMLDLQQQMHFIDQHNHHMMQQQHQQLQQQDHHYLDNHHHHFQSYPQSASSSTSSTSSSPRLSSHSPDLNNTTSSLHTLDMSNLLSSNNFLAMSPYTTTTNTTATNSSNQDISSPLSSSMDIPGLKKKRTRASTDQLMILEDVFGSTRNPNAALRKELAERCGMRERSVQIWFQNRRARSRPPGLRRKNNPQQLLFLNSTSTAATHSPTTPTSAISMATPTSAIPTPSSTTSLLFPPPISTLSSHHHTISSFPSSTPTSAYLPSPSASILPLSATSSMGLLTPYSSHPLNPLPVHTTLPTHMTTPSTPIHHLPITSLSCGTWRRTLDPNRRDLLAGANLSSRCLQFVIDCNNTGFRVEIPFDSILHINSIPSPSADELHLSIDLAYPPNFCMQVDAPQSKIWIRCSDFTEGGQGSSILSHRISGPRDALFNALASAVKGDHHLSVVANGFLESAVASATPEGLPMSSFMGRMA